MKVLRCDPPLARSGAAGDFVDYRTALDADIVSFHVPYLREGDEATFHLLGAEEIAERPAGQILINASRGEVWDNRALLVRQQGPHPLRLVMDVWEGEPEPLNELVPHTELATPHIAGYSLEGKARGTWMLYEALCRQLGRTPRQDLQSLLPAPEVRELTPGQPADQALIKQLVHLVYDVRRDDARFRNRIGLPGSFDEQRKRYPGRACHQTDTRASRGPHARPRRAASQENRSVSQQFNVAVLGASGAVGQAMIEILEERAFPVATLYPLASSRSAGDTVRFGGKNVDILDVEAFDWSQVEIALFSAGAEVSAKWAPIAAEHGCIVIDNTSCFRYDEDHRQPQLLHHPDAGGPQAPAR